MTRSSETRKARRASPKPEPEVVAKREPVMKIPERPTSLIQFTELDGGGFTFSLGLYGALLAELNPDHTVPVSVVDVMALAVVHLIRSNSPDLAAAHQLVYDTLTKVHEGIADGKDVEQVLREASVATGGTLVAADAVQEDSESAAS